METYNIGMSGRWKDEVIITVLDETEVLNRQLSFAQERVS
jgi:hypothetical protein